MLRCPNCRNARVLEIVALVTVRLYQDVFAEEIEGTEPVDGTHEWNDDSLITCPKCRHQGRVIEFTADGVANEGPKAPIVWPEDSQEYMNELMELRQACARQREHLREARDATNKEESE